MPVVVAGKHTLSSDSQETIACTPTKLEKAMEVMSREPLEASPHEQGKQPQPRLLSLRKKAPAESQKDIVAGTQLDEQKDSQAEPTWWGWKGSWKSSWNEQEWDWGYNSAGRSWGTGWNKWDEEIMDEQWKEPDPEIQALCRPSSMDQIEMAGQQKQLSATNPAPAVDAKQCPTTLPKDEKKPGEKPDEKPPDEKPDKPESEMTEKEIKASMRKEEQKKQAHARYMRFYRSLRSKALSVSTRMQI